MERISVKEKVLHLLDEHKGTYYSGQELAEELQVSRTAIWKAVSGLRDEGYAIEGSTKLGYCLAENTDVFQVDIVRQQLDEEAKKFYRVNYVKEIDSTNIAVRDRGMEGEAEGLCIVAEKQTAGRGRRGRTFYSPKASGLYMSILLRPKLSFEQSILITTAAAAAAARACESVNTSLKDGDVQIKWVNDLFVNEKKICGILTEGFLSMENGGLDFAVLGIGFNLTAPENGWPDKLKDIAGSLFEHDFPAGSRNRLVSAFLNDFLPYYNNLADLGFLEEYRRRQLVVGKDVMVLQADGTKQKAKAVGIDNQCRLLVRFEDADEVIALNSGEISVKMQG